MLKNLDMDYSLTNITNNIFTEISNSILQYKNNFSFLSQGTKEQDTYSNCTNNPKNYYLADLSTTECTPLPVKVEVTDVINDIETSNLSCTLASYYPEEGFIGWHTNSNFSFFNAICTFSDLGKSGFKYLDGNTVVEIQDNIGWSVKKTEWSSSSPTPHFAFSDCNRITITFSSSNEEIIDSFIEELV